MVVTVNLSLRTIPEVYQVDKQNTPEWGVLQQHELFEDFVDNAVLEGLFSIHKEVAVYILFNLL